jgi:hypothetical protein
MRAKLRYLHSTDIDDLENWTPGPDFGVSIQILVGPIDAEGEESFQVTVCSPRWFAEQMSETEIRSGHHVIFMLEYNYRRLLAFIEHAIHRTEAATWSELGAKLSWLGQWEFEEYRAQLES